MPSRLRSSPEARQRAHALGHRAETIAAWYLRLKGYRIIALRYRNHGGEIDLLATRGKLLAVVEVKARKTLAECANSVPPAKQQKIVRALEGLSASSGKIAGLAGVAHRNIRFDVIAVVPGRLPHHIKDAWRL